MFTDGRIWSVMLQLKVFRPEEVLNALNPPAGFRKWIKQRVHSLIAKQTELGLLRRVVENPPVFATLYATEEDLQRVLKPCSVCGRLFIPVRSDYHICSDECRQQLRQARTRQKRKQAGVGSVKKKWTEEELKTIQELLYRHAKYGEYEELARKLGRSKKAVLSKVEELRYRRKEVGNET